VLALVVADDLDDEVERRKRLPLAASLSLGLAAFIDSPLLERQLVAAAQLRKSEIAQQRRRDANLVAFTGVDLVGCYR
jgi:hypothetical protein